MQPKPQPIEAFAALDRNGCIMPNSICDSMDGVRLAVGECTPIRVKIIPILEDE